MISSIILLLVLQLFWLRNSYERAFFGLRRESNFIFRNTLYSMRDSLNQALSDTRELITLIKRNKKQNRLVETTLRSLKQLEQIAS